MYASSKPMGSLYPAPYRLKDVGSLNDLRPAVNLKRSKTSVNPTSTQLLYRSASMQAVTRSYSTAPQFRQYVARYRQADIPLPGSAATNSRYRRLKPGGGHGGRNGGDAEKQRSEHQLGRDERRGGQRGGGHHRRRHPTQEQESIAIPVIGQHHYGQRGRDAAI